MASPGGLVIDDDIDNGSSEKSPGALPLRGFLVEAVRDQ
jgi:hypothetical protein